MATPLGFSRDFGSRFRVHLCYVNLDLFCGFFRHFRFDSRFGVFFELVSNSDCIRQKRNVVPMKTGGRFFGRARNTFHPIAAHVYTRRFAFAIVRDQGENGSCCFDGRELLWTLKKNILSGVVIGPGSIKLRVLYLFVYVRRKNLTKNQNEILETNWFSIQDVMLTCLFFKLHNRLNASHDFFLIRSTDVFFRGKQQSAKFKNSIISFL